MSKYRTDLTKGLPLPSTWVNALMEFVGSLAANLQITQPSATTVAIPAGTDNAQVAIAINGKWRYNTATVTASHPGGVAGVYDVFVTAADNDFSAPDPADSTNYAFGVVILPSGATPTSALYRRVASCTWDGTKITSVTPVTQTIPTPSLGRLVGAYADRPPASTTLNGVRFFASDKGMEWQVVAGAWVLVSVAPPEVTALPASPIDQQECVYLADATNGIKWHLRYRAASASAYKWEVIGGSSLMNWVGSTSNVSTASSAYQDCGCSVTVPLAGDYEIAHGGLLSYEGGGVGNFSGDGALSYAVGAAAAIDLDAAEAVMPNNGAGLTTWTQVAKEKRKTVPTAASTLALKLRAVLFINSGGGFIAVRDRWIRARPVRVG